MGLGGRQRENSGRMEEEKEIETREEEDSKDVKAINKRSQ